MESKPDEVWVTGIGLVSSIGEGLETHWRHLTTDTPPKPILDEESFAPYPVHPQAEIDVSSQIPKRGDQRQMGNWQQLGTYAAGLALADANLTQKSEYLQEMNLVVAAGAGRRDEEVDTAILEGLGQSNDPAAFLVESLSNELRPTLFLSQLTNLLAGNISIVHGVTGTSRTLMGEDPGGLAAMQTATRQIQSGQGDLFLVGGAYYASRADGILIWEAGNYLWDKPHVPVWSRTDEGGFIFGTAGTFLVLEARAHAEARGVKPYARIHSIEGDRCRREPGEATRIAKEQFDRMSRDIPKGPLAILSGASGVQPVTDEERGFLESLAERGYDPVYRGYGTQFGQSNEAHFLLGMALGALALSKGEFFTPFDSTGFEKDFTGNIQQMLLNFWGSWRGEGMALIDTPPDTATRGEG